MKIISRKTGLRRNDIIDIFIDELDKEREDNFLSKEDFELGIVCTAIIFFFAGFDTTATTLSLVVYALINYPETQDKLRREIEDVVGADEEITADHLKELKYMENVLNEVMRYYFTIGETSHSIETDSLYIHLLKESRELALRTTECLEWILSSRRA